MHDFGSRIRPDEITPELREQLVADCRLSEALLQSATFIGGVAISLVLSLVYRWHGEAWGSEWKPILGIVFLAVLTMIGIRIWFRWEYHFFKAAPIAAAEVKEIAVEPGDKHLVTLKFELQHDPGTPAHQEVVTTELHSEAPAFNEQLQAGDLVSVLYEPSNPEHVHIVEQEHLVESK